MRCPLAYSAGAWGLRPHGGDDHVAFAAHHRRHTERLPCALRSQCPISRSHPSTAHPSGPQTPVPPKGTSPPRLAHPTSSPLSPPPHQRHEYLSSAQLILLSLNETIVRRPPLAPCTCVIRE